MRSTPPSRSARGWRAGKAPGRREPMRPHFLALLSEACVPAGGEEDPGLRVLDEALTLAQSTGERMYEAEVCRLRGERLLSGARDQADVAAAETYFEQALAIARRQEALSLGMLPRGHRAWLACVGPAPCRRTISSSPSTNGSRRASTRSTCVKHEACSICA